MHVLLDDELCNALQYDLRSFLHVNPAGLFTGQYSMRELAIWLNHLPPESALVKRRMAGDNKIGLQERLLAQCINEIKLLRYDTMQVGKPPEEKIQPELINFGDEEG